MLVFNPRCEWLQHPTIATQTPRLTWALSSSVQGDLQTAYQIQVGSTPGSNNVWDSGQVSSAAQMVLYAGPAFVSRQRLFWQVRVWDASGTASQWTASVFFVGLLNTSDWGSACWIGYNTGSITVSSPAACLSKPFVTPAKTIVRAVLYASALGAYVPYLNGTRVDQSELHPGWTDFTVRRQYQAFDLTPLMIANGQNVIGLMVGDGRCMGNMLHNPKATATQGYGGSAWKNYYYADVPRALGTLYIDYSDGTTTQIVTDGTWRAVVGENQANDIYNGSSQDLRQAICFTNTAYASLAWNAVDASVALGSVPLVPQPSPPIRRQETLTAAKVTNPSTGTYIFDFGQNHAGLCQVTLRACTAGSTVRVRMAEDVYANGQIYVTNLRTALNGVYVTATGAAVEIAESMFTSSGGRYAEVTGYTGTPQSDAVKRVVAHTDMPAISTFECSSSVLNGIWTACYWTVRSNAQEIPQDCCQRDERLGWAADMAAGVRSYNTFFDAIAFADKWCTDADDALGIYGKGTDTSPFDSAYYLGSVGWAEAGTIVPWENYVVTGDPTFLSRHFAAAVTQMGLEPGHDQWGDYLNENDPTNSAVHAALWAYRQAYLTNQMAIVLGNTAEASASASTMATFLADFQAQVGAGAVVTGNSQTSYILGLYFGMFTAAQIPQAVAILVGLIQTNGLTCGLLGTSHVLDVLSDNGQHALAVQVALNTWQVGWGYDWASGLTTTPERWEAPTYQSVSGSNIDNSYSHTVRTAGIVPWLMKRVAGIATLSSAPGFSTVLMAPIPTSRITSGQGSLNTVRGLVSSKWSMGPLGMQWSLTIPPNSTGTVVVPAGLPSLLLANGKPLTGVTSAGPDPVTGGTKYLFPSGSYAFTASALAA